MRKPVKPLDIGKAMIFISMWLIFIIKQFYLSIIHNERQTNWRKWLSICKNSVYHAGLNELENGATGFGLCWGRMKSISPTSLYSL
ncbi:TPA: hypothetical protein ACKRTE_000267 [Providencia rettgeri]